MTSVDVGHQGSLGQTHVDPWARGQRRLLEEGGEKGPGEMDEAQNIGKVTGCD